MRRVLADAFACKETTRRKEDEPLSRSNVPLHLPGTHGAHAPTRGFRLLRPARLVSDVRHAWRLAGIAAFAKFARENPARTPLIYTERFFRQNLSRILIFRALFFWLRMVKFFSWSLFPSLVGGNEQTPCNRENKSQRDGGLSPRPLWVQRRAFATRHWRDIPGGWGSGNPRQDAFGQVQGSACRGPTSAGVFLA